MALPYYKRLLLLKRFTLPVVLAFDRLHLMPLLAPIGNFALRLFGLKKRFSPQMDYRTYGKVFAKAFPEVDRESHVVFLMMSGVNSRHNFRNMLLAKYLGKKGHHSAFLICNGVFNICIRDRITRDRSAIPFFCTECHGGYDWLGKVTHLPIEKLGDYSDSAIQREFDGIKKAIDGLASIEECKQFAVNNHPIGSIIKKTVLRYLTQGEFRKTDFELDVYKKQLESAALFLLIFARYLEQNPELRYVVLNNGELTFDAIAMELAKGRKIETITQEHFEAPNSWIYKRNGIAIQLKWEEDWPAFRENTVLSEQQMGTVREFMQNRRVGKNMMYKYNDPGAKRFVDRAKDRKLVGLFTNFTWDTTVLDRRSIFDSMNQWLLETIRFWKETDCNATLVVRAHPAEVKLLTSPSAQYVRDIIAGECESENILFIDSTEDVNSYEVIDAMDYGIVYNSSVGLEIAFAGKPCVVAADPHYRGKSFVLSPDSQAEYFGTLTEWNQAIEPVASDSSELYLYLYYFYFHRVKYLQGFHSGGPSTQTFVEERDVATLLDLNATVLDEFYSECFNRRDAET